MKKRMKRNVAMLMLAGMLTLTACGSGSGDAEGAGSGSDGEMYTATMVYIGSEQADMDKVEAAMNEILAREVGAQIDIVPLSWGNQQQQIQLMLSGNDKIDIVPVLMDRANSFVNSGMVMDMNDLIDQYGTNIKESLGDMAKVSSINGYVFGVPIEKEWYMDSCVLMRKDIVDKYNMDLSGIKTFKDCEEIFKTVQENEPGMKVIVGSKDAGCLSKIGYCDTLMDGFGVLADGGRSTTVENMYENEVYLEQARVVHDFYEKGYIDKDMPTCTDTPQTVMKAGNAFCYLSPYKPGVAEQDSLAAGYELIAVNIQPVEAYCYNEASSYVSWGIAQSSENPEMAMKVLDFMYGSAEIMNLYNWGIEGEHYVVKDAENDIIGFPEGIDSNNTAYNLNLGWELPNQWDIHIWEGNSPETMKAQEEMNHTAIRSEALGFMYDYSSLSNELTALTNIVNEYRNSLNCGVSDPDEVLPEMNEKLYKAGLQKVIDEKQRQFDEWRAAQGE